MRFWWSSGVVAGLVLIGTVPIQSAPATVHPAVKAAYEGRSARLDNITDWNEFISEFRRAVEHRDRRALRSAMDISFRYTFDRTMGGDPRDEAMDVWDRSGDHVWATLERVLDKGNRNDPQVPGLMVSPPAWVDDNHYIGYRAGFMKVKGNWRWIWFVTGDY